MKFEIRNRWTGDLQFTAEIDCPLDAPPSLKVGLAVKWALKEKANLDGANLTRADLDGANLDGANLTRANLYGANLYGANLYGANLTRANLTRANLTRADLTRADLARANLTRANLYGANLRRFKADLWMTLTQNRAEVPALIAALKEGRVDGSTYSGECACLVGTIANAKHVSVETLERSSSNPAEQWFLMIRQGDKPSDETGGGFACKMALEWANEWCALNGIEVQL